MPVTPFIETLKKSRRGENVNFLLSAVFQAEEYILSMAAFVL